MTTPLEWDAASGLWYFTTPVKDGEIRTYRLLNGMEGSLARNPRTIGYEDGLWELVFFTPEGRSLDDGAGSLTLAQAAVLLRRFAALQQASAGLRGLSELSPEDRANALSDELRSLLTTKLPYVNAEVSTLGSVLTPSVLIRFSADPPASWVRRILQNSRWGLLHITLRSGQYEIHSGQYGRSLPSLRAAKVTTPEAVVKKIRAWLDKVEV